VEKKEGGKKKGDARECSSSGTAVQGEGYGRKGKAKRGRRHCTLIMESRKRKKESHLEEWAARLSINEKVRRERANAPINRDRKYGTLAYP